MTISDFRDWLRTKIDAAHWYSGGLRTTGGQAIAIFNGRAFTNPIAIGGARNSSYKGKGIRILVNWNKNVIQSEQKAMEVYNYLRGLNNVQIANKRVIQFNLRDPEPIYLGVDDSSIYEYVIDLEIIHER